MYDMLEEWCFPVVHLKCSLEIEDIDPASLATRIESQCFVYITIMLDQRDPYNLLAFPELNILL